MGKYRGSIHAILRDLLHFAEGVLCRPEAPIEVQQGSTQCDNHENDGHYGDALSHAKSRFPKTCRPSARGLSREDSGPHGATSLSGSRNGIEQCR